MFGPNEREFEELRSRVEALERMLLNMHVTPPLARETVDNQAINISLDQSSIQIDASQITNMGAILSSQFVPPFEEHDCDDRIIMIQAPGGSVSAGSIVASGGGTATGPNYTFNATGGGITITATSHTVTFNVPTGGTGGFWNFVYSTATGDNWTTTWGPPADYNGTAYTEVYPGAITIWDLPYWTDKGTNQDISSSLLTNLGQTYWERVGGGSYCTLHMLASTVADTIEFPVRLIRGIAGVFGNIGNPSGHADGTVAYDTGLLVPPAGDTIVWSQNGLWQHVPQMSAVFALSDYPGQGLPGVGRPAYAVVYSDVQTGAGTKWYFGKWGTDKTGNQISGGLVTGLGNYNITYSGIGPPSSSLGAPNDSYMDMTDPTAPLVYVKS
jgi:hypothetical protein